MNDSGFSPFKLPTLEVNVNGKKINKRNIVKPPKETKNCGLKIVPFPTNKTKIKQRKLMKDHIIPKHASSVIFNGRSGSGKTNLLVNLMSRPEFYGPDKKGKPYFDLVFLFSPTASGGDDLVRYLNIDPNNIYTDFDQTALENLIAKQKQFIEKKGLMKSPKILIIFEDIQSDQKFMRSKCFLKCFIMCRHLNISTFLLSQSFTKTPRACRLQCNNVFFFQGSKSEHELICEEYMAPGLTKKEMYDLVDYATTDDYSFLHINMRCPFKTRYRKNIDEILALNK